jgi:hypothetical protein
LKKQKLVDLVKNCLEDTSRADFWWERTYGRKEASWVAIQDRAAYSRVLIPTTAKATKRDLIILASIFFSV